MYHFHAYQQRRVNQALALTLIRGKNFSSSWNILDRYFVIIKERLLQFHTNTLIFTMQIYLYLLNKLNVKWCSGVAYYYDITCLYRAITCFQRVIGRKHDLYKTYKDKKLLFHS